MKMIFIYKFGYDEALDIWLNILLLLESSPEVRNRKKVKPGTHYPHVT
jgi:hypothetical protein